MTNTTTKIVPNVSSKLTLKPDLTLTELEQLAKLQKQFDTYSDQLISVAALATKTGKEEVELLGLLTTIFVLRENLAATIINSFFIITSA